MRLLSFFLAIELLMGVLEAYSPINSVRDLEPFLEQSFENDLLVFDIDDTLTILEEPAFQRLNFKGYHQELFEQLISPLARDKRVVAFTLPLFTSSKLIEEESPAFIRACQEKQIKVIALTAAMGGPLVDTTVEDRRISELKRLGIDFSLSFLHAPLTIFSLPVLHLGRLPLFKKGILFTNDVDKGTVLVEFIKNESWIPQRVIFVDDRRDHLEAVEKALKAFDPNIFFIGLHYQPNEGLYEKTDGQTFQQKWEEMIRWAEELNLLELANNPNK